MNNMMNTTEKRLVALAFLVAYAVSFSGVWPAATAATLTPFGVFCLTYLFIGFLVGILAIFILLEA